MDVFDLMDVFDPMDVFDSIDCYDPIDVREGRLLAVCGIFLYTPLKL